MHGTRRSVLVAVSIVALPAIAGRAPVFAAAPSYPLVAQYTGSGSTDDAADFTCRRGF